MENNKALIFGGIVGIVALGVSFFTGQDTIVVQPNVEKTIEASTGGASSDFSTRYLSWGGVRNWATGVRLDGTAASTTICAIAAPTASSSLEFLAVRANSGTTTSMQVQAFKSASPFLTTTAVTGETVFASMTETVAVATSTVVDSTARLFTSGDYLVVTMTPATGGNGPVSPTGQCNAQFVQI